MRNLISRGLAATGLAAALTLGASACAAAVVEKDEVAASVASVLQEQGVGVENMTCPADLQAVTGESMRCEFTTGGQPVDAVVTVTSVEGGTAHYDVHTEARPVAKELLAQKVAELVSEDAAVAIDTAECAGDLPPQVGGSTACQLTAGGDSAEFTVTVTSVDGGLINFSVT